MFSERSSTRPPARIVGHRGEPFLAPENTLASFAHAWAEPMTAIELDVHLTADGELVVCHDADTFRTSGGRTRLTLGRSSLAQIQAVDVGYLRGLPAGRQRCPALAEVYTAMPAGAVCFTELKGGVDIVPPFVQTVRQAGLRPAQVVVISFDASALARSRQELPDSTHLYLNGFAADPATGRWMTTPGVDDWIETALRAGCDGLGLGAQPPLDANACTRIIAAGLQLHVWATGDPERASDSIDRPDVARQYVEWGARSLTVNRARWLRDQLRDVVPVA